jgi:uncharacterized protein YuzE
LCPPKEIAGLPTISIHEAVVSVKVTYDPQSDTLRILLSSATIEDMSTEQPGIIFNYDDDGQLIGLEILNASKRVEDPLSVQYAVLQNGTSEAFSPENRETSP